MKIETSIKTCSNEEEQHQQQNGNKIKRCVDRSNSLWFSKRFFVAVVLFLCYINVAMIMSNFNIAVVEMTSAKAIVVGNRTVVRPAEFKWDPSVIGLITSIHSYGGLFCLIGGFFVNKLGGSLSCVIVTIMCGISTMLQPAALYLDFRLFVVLRLMIGCFSNCFFISAVEIYSKWFPITERSTLILFSCNGFNVGSTLLYPLFGYIADRQGWRMVFYVSGLISIAAALVCLIFVKNKPSQDKCISDEELSYILDGTHDLPSKQNFHPYMKILLSSAVWALCLTDFTSVWLDNILIGCVSLYAKDSTGRSTDEIGLLSSIPVAITIFLYPLTGTFMDYWKNHASRSDFTRIDKSVVGCVFFSISLLFVICTIFSNFITSMIIFVVIQAVKSMLPSVLEPNIVNIAPSDSSVVAALTKFSTSIGVIISRTLTGFMTINHTAQEWNNCFILASVVSIIGATIFIKYGSSEAQSWSLHPKIEDERDCLIEKRKLDNNNSYYYKPDVPL